MALAIVVSGTSTWGMWQSEAGQRFTAEANARTLERVQSRLTARQFEAVKSQLSANTLSPIMHATQRVQRLGLQTFAVTTLLWVVGSILFAREDIRFGDVLPIVARAAVLLALSDLAWAVLTYGTGQLVEKPYSLSSVMFLVGIADGTWPKLIGSLDGLLLVWLAVLARGLGPLFRAPWGLLFFCLSCVYVGLALVLQLWFGFGGGAGGGHH